MISLQVLPAVRKLIFDNEDMKKFGLLAENIYVCIPDIAPDKWPVVFLEIEEIWSGKKKASRVGDVKVSFKLTVLSDKDDGSAALNIADLIKNLIEGAELDLGDYYTASLKLKSNIVDIKKIAKAPRKVEQNYEALVRFVKPLSLSQEA